MKYDIFSWLICVVANITKDQNPDITLKSHYLFLRINCIYKKGFEIDYLNMLVLDLQSLYIREAKAGQDMICIDYIQ